MEQEKKYKNILQEKITILIPKINSKISQYNNLNAVLLGFGIILLLCIPFLYIFDFADLIPLALIMGIFSLVMVTKLGVLLLALFGFAAVIYILFFL